MIVSALLVGTCRRQVRFGAALPANILRLTAHARAEYNVSQNTKLSQVHAVHL